MPPEKQRRRRVVTACIPCYSKKQKCNRQYPCNHCLRRRQPELCIYAVPDSAAQKRGPNTPTTPLVSVDNQNGADNIESPPMGLEGGMLSWLGSFGEGGPANLLSLLQKNLDTASNSSTPPHVVNDVKSVIQMLPKRSMIDRLIQHYISEVNWIYQLIHPPIFLKRYEEWWKGLPGSNIESLEFCVLILRICAFTSQFVSSGSEGLFGMSQSTIREHCHNLASRLSRATHQIPVAKSLISVQELFLASCYLKNDGRGKEAWTATGDAIRIAQDLGLHREFVVPPRVPMSEFEREIRKRTFCNLFLLDRFLSVVLDRLPCIPDEYCPMPSLRLVPDTEDPHMPDAFGERGLQIRFTKLIYSMLSTTTPNNDTYDLIGVEEKYERLRREFVLTLPPAFCINDPDTRWDGRQTDLPRQRQSLWMGLFLFLCQLFKPVLKLTSDEIESMAQYKRNLLATHRNLLVQSAFSLLGCSAELHRLMGRTKIAFFQLIFQTFEGAMILVLHLFTYETALKPTLISQEKPHPHSIWASKHAVNFPQGSIISEADLVRCRPEIEAAVQRLTMFSEASSMARVAAQTLREALVQLDSIQDLSRTPTPNKDGSGDTVTDNLSPFDFNSFGVDNDNSWLEVDMPLDMHSNLSSAFDYSTFLDSNALLNWAGLPWEEAAM